MQTQKVRISKLGAVHDPEYPTPEKGNYKYGQYNPYVSVPVDYTVEGTLMYPIEVGKTVLVDRTKRNGVEVNGLFRSSSVTKITKTGFHTLNSRYKVEYL